MHVLLNETMAALAAFDAFIVIGVVMILGLGLFTYAVTRSG